MHAADGIARLQMENQLAVPGDGQRSATNPAPASHCEEESAVLDFPAVLDVMTMKYAIYFIAPIAVLYVIASVCAPALILAAQLVVGRDVSHDSAASMMAVVIVAGTGVATFVHWTTRVPWAALTSGSAAFFFVGTILYSRGIKHSTKPGRKRIVPIGLSKGALISAIITFCASVVTLFVLWAIELAGRT